MVLVLLDQPLPDLIIDQVIVLNMSPGTTIPKQVLLLLLCMYIYVQISIKYVG